MTKSPPPAFVSQLSPEERERALQIMDEMKEVYYDGAHRITVRDGSVHCPDAMITIKIDDKLFAFDAVVDEQGYVKLIELPR